ncbi:tetratricopeptide repeat protein [Acinetobacter nosocomialis]|uniref:tetratricopeptide repeat protein n=1 Tax=Acinetobacter nosocomialis TaxID=106654 RepID=UPI003BFA7A61
MNIRYLIISSVISLSTLSTICCSKPLSQLNNTQSELSEIYEQGGKYFLGKEVPKDYSKAFSYFKKAAEKGLPIAQNDLAGMYLKGIGTQKSEEKAYYWYEKAAKNDFPEAQYNMGLMYDNGYYVSKNRSKALEFYKLAAHQGYAKAQYK